MKIIKKDNNYVLDCNENEISLVDRLENIELNVIEVNEDVFVLSKNISKKKIKAQNTFQSLPEKDKGSLLDIKNKIYQILDNRDISVKDKVEGRFEKLFLTDLDLPIFKKMIKKNEIILFKLSEKYKRNIYKVNEGLEESKQKEANLKNPILNNKNNLDFKNAADFEDSFSSFDNDQYIIITNQNLALHFSEKYKEQIKNNEIVGLKSFDGNYYVISVELFSEIKNKILNLKMPSTFSIEDLSSKLSLDNDIIKITLEILKEDCLVIEKKKNLFQFV